VTTARAGETVFYRLEARLENVGLSSGASSVVVTDVLPAGVELVSTKVNRGPGCSGSTTITCPLDFISADVVGVIEIVVRVTGEGEFVNVATATSVPTDIDSSNNTAQVTVVVPQVERAPASPEIVSTPSVRKVGVTRRGNVGANALRGTSFADFLYGLAGNDQLFGLAGNDRLFGGPGNDLLYGAAGNDRLHGEAGNDVLNGGQGSDQLDAGAGNDTIQARDGNRDDVRCGGGNDAVLVDKKDKVARNCETIARR
jgi:uncharacterized repeat protein (TIGR01451 family)